METRTSSPERGADALVGATPVMRELRERLSRAAGVDVPVLLTGETGTGKTTAARILHGESSRRDGPFVALNCAGVPDGLFESELFGHERGAFTGAVGRRGGLLLAAHRGTLFLDEIGDLPLHQQAKLLTVLEDREVRPVGGERTRRVDIRLVSATSNELEREVRRGRFRGELFHRIAVLRIHLPPLRERVLDIPLLARHLVRCVATRHRIAPPPLTPAAEAFLRSLPWPGNVREMAHLLEAAMVLADEPELSVAALRAAIPETGGEASLATDPAPEHLVGGSRPTGRYSFFGSPEEERRAVLTALRRHHGNRTRAARELGMSRGTLRDRIRRFELE